MFSDHHGDSDSPFDGGRLPSLLALRCFSVAAQLENFTRAAERLHLTHGAISRAVRTLEDDLGVALFERRSRRVFLTDAGRTLAKAAHDGFGMIQQATSELRASVTQSRQWVLSCEPTLLLRWLIPRWPDFQALYPDIEVHLVAGGGPFSFGSGIDMAIRRNDFAWPDSCHVERLFAEKIGPVCRPDKARAWFSMEKGTAALRPGAIRLNSRTRARAWEEWAVAAENTLLEAPEKRFEHFYLSLQAAVAGLGVAIGPWHLVQDDLKTGMLTAPMDFVEDGSHYCLLSPQPLSSSSPKAGLLTWLRSIA